VYRRAQARGWGQQGFPVVARVLEEMAAVELRAPAGPEGARYEERDPRRGGEAMADQPEDLARLLLEREVANFLYHEAELLDERRYEEWLDLLADDIRYWMPMRRNVKLGELEREFTREGLDVNWFDEGKDTLRRRVQQILTGVHWAEEPLSRICHMVSNVQVLAAAPSVQAPSEVTVKSRFLIYRNRVETETDLLVGKREDVLRRVDGRWKIGRRAIVLDQSVLLSKNLTFFF
jgi:3-phenylpropionate/cinnamic acid dioxygenase small subunit